MKIRSIHPEFFTDRKISELPPLARLLYIGLWCHANDYGHGRYLPKQLEGAIFPDEIVDIVGLLQWLEKFKLIRIYEVDGERFYEVPSWEDWQKPRYRAVTKIPSPDEGFYVDSALVYTSLNMFGPTSDESLPTSAQSFEKSGKGEGEVVGEVVGEGEGEAAGVFRAAQSDFEVFHRRRVAGLPQVAAANNPNAMAFKLVNADDVREESERIWAHRSCRACQGKGFTEVYSPGAGMVKSNCTEETDE